MSNDSVVQEEAIKADQAEFEAVNMKLRRELMMAITMAIKGAKWSQKDAAINCHISQPRISQLLHGHVSCFSLDALVKIAFSLGLLVRIVTEENMVE